MANNKILLELKNVNKQFDDVVVASDFNLQINKKEFVTFLGPSGCGKTTTLRMIAGFENPDSGEILLNGQDISKLPPYQRPLNTVFQRYALFQHLDVYDNIAFGLKLAKIPYVKQTKKGEVTKTRHLTRREIDEKVVKALKIVDLEGFETRDVSTLSGGQQQRVAIARAIVNEPEILLLDEPLGALDLKMRKEMQIELKKMQRKLGITFIYVTHDQEEALTMSDRIVVMKDGEIQQIGKPTDIYNEPANAFVADFIGESNIYVATMIDKLKVRFLGHVWDCVDDFPINEKVDVVVRPEDIIINNEEKGVKAKIVDKVFKGIHYQFTCMVGNNEVEVQTTLDHNVGEEVYLQIEPDLIQIMEREYDTNIYEDAYIDKFNNVVFAGASWECDVTKLVKGSKVDEDGYFITPDNKKYDLNDIDVVASVNMTDIDISDNLEEGNITGKIIQMVWKGDHYQLIVRTEDQEDFVLDTEYTWNEGDQVSVIIKKEDINLKLKEDLSKHEI